MNVLITGGSGLVGGALTRLLKTGGHQVRWLSRTNKNTGAAKVFHWDPSAKRIDLKAFDGVTHLVHLAGAGIADKRWTKKYKQELSDSRIRSSEFLSDVLRDNDFKLNAVVGASASGYYGSGEVTQKFNESSAPGNDFLAKLCVDWEHSYLGFATTAKRTCIVRTAPVLSNKGGLLKKMMPAFRVGLGAPLGSGRQPFPWIHINDLAGIYYLLVTNERLNGAFNAAADETVSNGDFSKTLANQLGKPYFMPAIPLWALKLIFGEVAFVMTEGQALTNEKIKNTGFSFRFPLLVQALRDIVSGDET
jgi:uncharacterized protein